MTISRLAASIGAALDALFVEERMLMRLAKNQLLRRVRMPGGAFEEFGAATLEEELRLHEAEQRRMVDGAASRAGIEWSFRTILDEPGDASIAIRSELAIVTFDGLLTQRREFLSRLFAYTPGLLVIPQRLPRFSHPALVVAPGHGPLSPALLHQARDFAQRFAGGAPLTLLFLGETASLASDEPMPQPGEAPLIVRRLPGIKDVAEVVANPPSGVDLLVLPVDDPVARMTTLARASLPTLLLRTATVPSKGGR